MDGKYKARDSRQFALAGRILIRQSNNNEILKFALRDRFLIDECGGYATACTATV